MNRKKLTYLPFFAVLLCVFWAYGERPQPRVSGLENDSLYMALLGQEMKLRSSEDSVSSLILRRRSSFAADTANRAVRAAELLALEEELFQIRNNLGQVAAKTNSIEQQYILENLNDRGSGPARPSGDHRHRGSLPGHPYIGESLPADEQQWLARHFAPAGSVEGAAREYAVLYERLEGLENLYAGAETQFLSDSLYSEYRALTHRLRSLESVLLREWKPVYEHKIYLYSLVLDRMNRTSELYALNETAKASRLAHPEKYLSPVFAEYPGERALLTDYEIAVSESLGMYEAADSLRRVKRGLDADAYRYPDIRLQEKEYVNYAAVEFVTPTIYDNSNPIPAIDIPEQGTYYSVTVGTFANRTAPSVFRNAVPVSYERLRNGQWRYYVGLFRTYGETVEAVETLRKAGFRRPEPVRWTDGVYENLAAAAEKNKGQFRIVVSGMSDLPAYAREIVGRMAAAKEITRVGETFYIGTFTDRLHGEEVVTALSAIAGLSAELESLP